MVRNEGRSLAETPTWVVGTVVALLVSIGFLLHGALKKFGEWLDRTKRKHLFSALEKIKEELMVFGLLSLPMGHWIVFVAKICVKSSALSSRFYPCTPPNYLKTRAFETHMDVLWSNSSISRLLLEDSKHEFCPKDHEPFASHESLEQLHRFLFVLGITHVSYSFLAIALAMIKVNQYHLQSYLLIYDWLGKSAKLAPQDWITSRRTRKYVNSISSWSRILPRGRLGGVNQLAILFYNKLIDNLLLRGIQPFLTIFHHEYPQELEDRFGGWLSSLMQDEYLHFAEVCFKYFGDRVKYWITINEPRLYAQMSYETAQYPPARCSPPFGNCVSGNSDVELLIVVHNMLLAHAKAAKLHRERFKSKLDGILGIAVAAMMYIPMTDDKNDKEAADRALAFDIAWTLDPLVFGDYPPEMKYYHGKRLPQFSSEERVLLRDSIDFIGLNHYGTLYAKDCIHSSCICNESSCLQGSDRAIRGFVFTSGVRNGVPIGEQTGMSRFFVVPRGMEDIVYYVKERYHNKAMIITENGYSFLANEDDNLQHDVKRIQYHQSYLAHLAQAIREGADVRGYIIWSLMDNFEWSSGYGPKFGLYQVDRHTMKRIPKLSASWFAHFLANFSLFDANFSATISYRNKDASRIQSE